MILFQNNRGEIRYTIIMLVFSNVNFSAEDDAEFARMAHPPASVARWRPFKQRQENRPVLNSCP